MRKLMPSDSLLDQNERFNLSESFDQRTGQKKYYFVYLPSGRRIETDVVGAAIWNSLPAKAVDLKNSLLAATHNFIQRIQVENIGKLGDSLISSILEVYFYILYRAGIILINGKSAVSWKKEEDFDGSLHLNHKGIYSYGNCGFTKKSVVSFSPNQKNNGKEIIAELRNDFLEKEKYKEEKSQEGELAAEESNDFLISAIVITYNGEKFISQCLKSLYEQTWPSLEILVVDNASTDQTREIINHQFPEVNLYCFPQNRHFARAVNFGLKKAKGRAIFILNQDVEMEKDCLFQLVLKSQKARNLPMGAVVPLLKFSDLRGIVNGLGNHIRPFSWGSDNFIGAVDVGQFANLEAVPSACFAAVLIFREALNQIGGLDEAYGSFYEDVDWSFRCWLSGWQIIPCPQAIVYHHFSSAYTEGKKLFFVCRNRLRLVLKLFSGKRCLSFLRNYIIEDLRSIFAFLRYRNWSKLFIYFKAYFSLAIRIPEIIIKRMEFKRSKIKGMTEAFILALNPIRWSFLNDNQEPVINLSLITDYYIKNLNIP